MLGREGYPRGGGVYPESNPPAGKLRSHGNVVPTGLFSEDAFHLSLSLQPLVRILQIEIVMFSLLFYEKKGHGERTFFKLTAFLKR